MDAAPGSDTADFSFVPISDSYLDFTKNPDPHARCDTARGAGTHCSHAETAGLMLHTGDVSHLSKAAESDAAAAMQMAGLATDYVPGEHGAIAGDGKESFSCFAPRGA